MPRRKLVSDDEASRAELGPPARSPEEREMQLTALAYDLVEQRLRSGEATSQETTFFLKLGGTREQLEREKLRQENLLLVARQEQIGQGHKMEELLEKAMRAFKGYSGEEPDPEEDAMGDEYYG